MTKLWTAAAPAFRESGDWPRQGLRHRPDPRGRPAPRKMERAIGVAVVPREDNAFANDNPPPVRNAVLARYRQLREISKRHHHDILKLISGDAMLQQAQRLGLAQGRTLILDDMDEMSYVFDLAIYTAPPRRSRAIDRYARSAQLPPGSGDARGALCDPHPRAPSRRGRRNCHRPVPPHRRLAGRHRTRGLIGGGSDDGEQALYPRAVLDDSRRQRAIRPCPDRGSLRRTAAPRG